MALLSPFIAFKKKKNLYSKLLCCEVIWEGVKIVPTCFPTRSLLLFKFRAKYMFQVIYSCISVEFGIGAMFAIVVNI